MNKESLELYLEFLDKQIDKMTKEVDRLKVLKKESLTAIKELKRESRSPKSS